MRYTNLANRLNDDVCALKNKNIVNDSVIDNKLFNFYYNKDCECPVLDDIAFDNNFVVREGYGFASSCTVDTDSELRLNSAMTHDRQKIQLCARTFQGVPRLTNSGLIPNVESKLIFSDDTSDIRNVDKVMEKSFLPLSMTPMIGCLQRNIQNPEHIVQKDGWVRGGSSTRQDMVSNDYLSRCGFEYQGKNWVRRESK